MKRRLLKPHCKLKKKKKNVMTLLLNSQQIFCALFVHKFIV